jgi:hypothetical protein
MEGIRQMGLATSRVVAIPELNVPASRALSQALAALLIFLGLLNLAAVLKYPQDREPDRCRAAIAADDGRLVTTESGAAICVE